AYEGHAVFSGVVRDHTRRSQRTCRQVLAEAVRGLAVVGGLEDPRIAIIHQVIVGAEIGRARLEMRRLDLGNYAPNRHARNVAGQVVPGLSAIARVPDLAVIRARPDKAFLNLRWRDGKNHLAIELAQVIAHDPARGNDAAGVLR